jgi:hypothetical protein
MLARHAQSVDPETGKSRLAVNAGRAGGQRTIERYGSSSAWGLKMALKRHHGIPLTGDANAAAATAASQRGGRRDGVESS